MLHGNRSNAATWLATTKVGAFGWFPEAMLRFFM
jgi:hypothetical protein